MSHVLKLTLYHTRCIRRLSLYSTLNALLAMSSPSFMILDKLATQAMVDKEFDLCVYPMREGG